MIQHIPTRLFVLFAALVLPSAIAAEAQVGQNMGVLNPNTATGSELAALPHMDAAKADSIVAGRPFMNMLDVNALVGASLDEDQQNELYARLFLPLNLNATSEEEILLVPGVGNRMGHEFDEYILTIPNLGNRMLREFKEYRPYSRIEQFRREIGKYVDDDEAARLERYVEIRP